MEPCCWGNYIQHREANANLKLFNDLFDDYDAETEKEITPTSKIIHLKKKVWEVLEIPQTSYIAQVNLHFVVSLNIINFCLAY